MKRVWFLLIFILFLVWYLVFFCLIMMLLVFIIFLLYFLILRYLGLEFFLFLIEFCFFLCVNNCILNKNCIYFFFFFISLMYLGYCLVNFFKNKVIDFVSIFIFVNLFWLIFFKLILRKLLFILNLGFNFNIFWIFVKVICNDVVIVE